ncbi:MAG: vitamin K epoxide reductase family protein [Chloroflexi bacterium]|nr:vitamin K epoxide reductase family protein [Chloroflexota bacterium]
MMALVVEKFRADVLRGWSVLLAAPGALDALYLTYVKVSHSRAAFCTTGGGCDVVNNSPYSQIFGVPVALLGFGVYALMLALLLLEDRAELLTEYGPLALFGLSLTGVLYSGWLTYVELQIIHAICPYCVVSALLLAGLLCLSSARLWRLNAVA